MNSILVINGPNLNMLGVREPDIYGTMDLAQINTAIIGACEELPVVVEFFQSNHEGGLIDRIQQAYYDGIDGIVINPGALTHYSYALRDAIASVPTPFVEVHLSDIHKREGWRSISVTAEVCVGQVCGKGWEGYVEAIKILNEMLENGVEAEG